MTNACATCASSFGSPQDPASEKAPLPGRYLGCCGRSICSRCLNQNKRYETYCPYCQITTEPSLLPQGLKDPPAYSSLENHHQQRSPPNHHHPQNDDDELPAYSTHAPLHAPREKFQPAEDVLHFLQPADSLPSLSLAYSVPLPALRKANNLYADLLLQGRKTVLIPGEFYKGGVSLSPEPVEGEEEDARKRKLRRFQVATKVAEYDVAMLYLKNADWNLEAAIDAYKEDEQWEKAHPLEAQSKKKGKSAKDVGMRRFVGASTSVSSSAR
ncbi:hypothetical protein M409DRAFT_28541 [Zasmidium cellare ATCC 36951]|uniref:RING-type domain-containing protein n=1 Tax=Zasmidium cellare ATCC 36951 TaxID=1080233 RepID=A0A6A6C1V4_ZASCE|nr:uncharacterized protein M409DRAFT_28541 [Zasmidium cellare ATCC 36951]KAF2160935.1 hypothetical protein M409DRAFT_28541 [Zasmidium cellare ATCC 36951]